MKKTKVTPQSNPAHDDFADPVTDGSKPIIDQTNPGSEVTVMVFDGSNVLTLPPGAPDPEDHLVFVQSGSAQAWLTEEHAMNKFAQDKDGQLYYNGNGIVPSDEFKPVNMVELGT